MAEQSVPLPTSAVLHAASKHFAIRCSKVNKEFMACKHEHSNPADCLDKGNEVLSCYVDLIKDAHAKAPSEFKAYYECLDYYSNKFEKCRKQQEAFEAAFKAKAE